MSVQCMVYTVNGSDNGTLRHDVCIAHNWVRSIECCRPRPRLVQPATRGARMEAIGARQAITRSTTRRRARERPRQPARSTAIVRRYQTPQAAATLTRELGRDQLAGSTLTPMRSAPASPARSCCAPVRPVLARPAEAPQGAIGLLTLTGYHGYHGVLQGNHGVLTGYYKVTQVCRMGAQGGARRRSTWLDAHGLPAWARELAAKARKKCSG